MEAKCIIDLKGRNGYIFMLMSTWDAIGFEHCAVEAEGGRRLAKAWVLDQNIPRCVISSVVVIRDC